MEQTLQGADQVVPNKAGKEAGGGGEGRGGGDVEVAVSKDVEQTP